MDTFFRLLLMSLPSGIGGMTKVGSIITIITKVCLMEEWTERDLHKISDSLACYGIKRRYSIDA